MIKPSKRIVRDPHFYWKILNMIFSFAILVLAAMILLGGKRDWFVTVALFLGICMSTSEGIMQLAKNRKILGYASSVFAGMLIVALIFRVFRIW